MLQARFDAVMKNMSGSTPGGASCRFLLAVSGGADSICMAELFLHSSLHLQFALAHCNFSLRSQESDADEAFVRDWAERNGVELHTVRFDTREYAAANSLSIEMAARELRYKWFQELCVSEGYAALCVAHNAGDNAETMMLNILRGTGVRGLCGIAPQTFIPCTGQRVPLLRPLLGFSREEILSHLEGQGLSHCEDSTNAQSEYKRNKLRNKVFPLLAEINPSFVAAMGREASVFRDASAILDDWFSEHRASFVTEESADSCTVDIAALKASGHASYVLFRILEAYAFPPETASAILELLSSGRTSAGKRFLSQAFVAEVSAACIQILPLEQTETVTAVIADHAGEYLVCGRRIAVEQIPWNKTMDPKQPAGTSVMAAGFPIVLRAWKEGDRLRPIGLKGSKKISDIFTDLHYSAQEKRSSVVAADSNEKVLALVGVRTDESVKVSDSTCSALVLRFL